MKCSELEKKAKKNRMLWYRRTNEWASVVVQPSNR